MVSSFGPYWVTGLRPRVGLRRPSVLAGAGASSGLYRPLDGTMIKVASLRSDRWMASPELVADFIGIRSDKGWHLETIPGLLRGRGRKSVYLLLPDFPIRGEPAVSLAAHFNLLREMRHLPNSQ